MTPSNALPNRDTTPDPLMGLQALASGTPLAEPTAEQMSQGVMDGLREVLHIVTTAAASVPELAEEARNAKQSIMKMMMRVQTMTEQGGDMGGGY